MTLVPAATGLASVVRDSDRADVVVLDRTPDTAARAGAEAPSPTLVPVRA
ncbi:MAG: hypothetical protein ABIP45_02040 [Knoellia sp.]